MELSTNIFDSAPSISFEESENEIKTPGMEFLEGQINEYTEYKSPPPISFEDAEPEQKQASAPQIKEVAAEPKKKPIDEKAMSFTVDMFVEMFDTSQYGLFMSLNKRKHIRRNFGNREQFDLAQENSLLTDEEIGKLPQDEQLQIKSQMKRYNRFIESMKDKFDDLHMSDKERSFIERPLKELCRRNGLDLPPGWALGFGIFNVFSNRFIDLSMD